MNVDERFLCGALERNERTERREYVSEFSGCNETLTFTVERLERLHEVSECTDVCLRVDSFVDR